MQNLPYCRCFQVFTKTNTIQQMFKLCLIYLIFSLELGMLNSGGMVNAEPFIENSGQEKRNFQSIPDGSKPFMAPADFQSANLESFIQNKDAKDNDASNKKPFQINNPSAEFKPQTNPHFSIKDEKANPLSPHDKETKHWDYFSQNRVDNWPQACRDGFRQSPINIRASDVDYTIMNELHFVNYNQSNTLQLSNNGHSILGNGFDLWPPRQRPYIYGGGLSGKYILSQFHFHWSYNHDDGSEHTIGSLHYPVEAHFVHTKEGYSQEEYMSKPDGIAVIGVFMALSDDATALATLDTGIRLVTHKDNTTWIHNYTMGVNLPSNLENFYRYSGSLTTPGCNEVVTWTIMAEPIGITDAQLKSLRQVRIGTRATLPDSNVRPLQPINGRRILYRSSSLNHEKLCKGNFEKSRTENNSAASIMRFSDFERTFLLSSVLLSIYFMLKGNH